MQLRASVVVEAGEARLERSSPAAPEPESACSALSTPWAAERQSECSLRGALRVSIGGFEIMFKHLKIFKSYHNPKGFLGSLGRTI